MMDQFFNFKIPSKWKMHLWAFIFEKFKIPKSKFGKIGRRRLKLIPRLYIVAISQKTNTENLNQKGVIYQVGSMTGLKGDLK